MESLNLQLMVLSMHLEIKYHTIPHLKAVKDSMEHTNGQGHGSIFN